MKEINFEKISEEELKALMIRRLDRNLSDIFLKTEIFYKHHL